MLVEGYFDFAHGVAGRRHRRGRQLRHGADAAAGAAAPPLRRRASSSASTRTRPARAPRSARATCWCGKASRSAWRCCRRAAIRTSSCARRVARRIRRSSIGAQPYLDFLVDRAAEAARHCDAGRPPGVPERDAGRRRADSRRRRPATSSPIGCRTGPASARTWSATRSARRRWPARPAVAPAAAGVAGAARPRPSATCWRSLMSTPAEAADAVTELEPADLVGLACAALLEAAQALARDERAQGRSGSVASRLLSELGEADVALPDRPFGAGGEAGPGGRLHPGPARSAARRGNDRKFSVRSTRFSKRGRPRRRRRHRRVPGPQDAGSSGRPGRRIGSRWLPGRPARPGDVVKEPLPGIR